MSGTRRTIFNNPQMKFVIAAIAMLLVQIPIAHADNVHVIAGSLKVNLRLGVGSCL